jgi:hypothetical protein
MSKMADIDLSIRDLLDGTMLSCQEIADQVGCPVEWVNDIVQERWDALMDSPEGKEFERGFEDAKDFA